MSYQMAALPPLHNSAAKEDFLWIDIEDRGEVTQRRARSHVMKAFRREERQVRRMRLLDRKHAIASTTHWKPPKRAIPISPRRATTRPQATTKTTTSLHHTTQKTASPQHTTNPSLQETARKSSNDKMLIKSSLYREPVPSGIDPFVSYPTKLDEMKNSLIHHCKY
jgi:hypothetical protein